MYTSFHAPTQPNCKWHWNNVSVQCNCNCTMQQFVCYAIVFVCWQMQMQISPLDMPPFTFKSTGNSGRQTKHGAVQVKMLFHGDFWWSYDDFTMVLWWFYGNFWRKKLKILWQWCRSLELIEGDVVEHHRWLQQLMLKSLHKLLLWSFSSFSQL